MKTIDFTKLANKSWNDINAIAKEVVVEYNKVVTAHPNVITEGLQHPIEVAELKLSECYKAEAAKRIERVSIETNDIIQRAREKQNDFLNSITGKALTDKFENSKKELYKRIVNINKEVREKMADYFMQKYNTIDYTLSIRETPHFLSDTDSTIIVQLTAHGNTEDILSVTFTHNDYWNGRVVDKLTFDVNATRAFGAGSYDAYRYIVIGKMLADEQKLTECLSSLFLNGVQEVIEIQEQARKLEYDYNQATTF